MAPSSFEQVGMRRQSSAPPIGQAHHPNGFLATQIPAQGCVRANGLRMDL